MATGKIARLTDKGFGFITIEGAEKDLFFHANELQDADYNDLQEGDMLEFDVTDSDKGQNATSITRA